MELASAPKGAPARRLEADKIDAKIVQWAAYKLRPSRSEVPTEETKGRDYFERRSATCEATCKTRARRPF